MKFATVYYRNRQAGCLAAGPSGYAFRYTRDYLGDASAPPISLTLPKRHGTYRSRILFPFFFGLLAEGVQKERQCRLLRLDEKDYFSRLAKTSRDGAIGAVCVCEKGTEP